MFVVPISKVYALENIYFENSQGIKFTKNEYEIIGKIYGTDYLERMTQEDYNWLIDLKINNNDIEVNSNYDYNHGTDIMPFEEIHSTANKKITIVKSCDTNKCMILVTTKWLSSPKVRSYDVIGTRFSNTSLYNDSIETKVQSDLGTERFNSSNNIVRYTNGFGVSVKLPTSNNLIISQKFYVNKSGKVYASYQHATKSISLSTSKLYTITSSGYGKVFSFYGNALNVYDQMGGVDININ